MMLKIAIGGFEDLMLSHKDNTTEDELRMAHRLS